MHTCSTNPLVVELCSISCNSHRSLQGVTHVSQMVQYPADCSTDTPALWVAHFAHPIEVEWIAKEAPTPKDWPRMLLQVRPSAANTYRDRDAMWHRGGSSCQGSRLEQ